jgi:SAM-dependent methyltransferase
MKADYRVHDRLYSEARAKGWDGWGGNERIAYGSIWIEQLLAYPEVPTMGEALELGCGEGHYARLLAEKGYQVTGVDISPTAIAWAKEKAQATAHQIFYLELDLTQTDVLPGKTFDFIIDGNCLHCIIGEDRQVFLANIYRLLKTTGLFYVACKCSQSANNEVVEFEGRPYRYIPNQSSLHAELEAAGFTIRKSDFHSTGHCTVYLTKRLP